MSTCHVAPLACKTATKLLTLRKADMVEWARKKRPRTHHTGVTDVPQSVHAWFPRATLLYGRRMLLLRLRLSCDCKLSIDITLPTVGKLSARGDDCKSLSALSGRRRFACNRLETRAGMPADPTGSALVDDGLWAPTACTSIECWSAALTVLLAPMTAVADLVDKNHIHGCSGIHNETALHAAVYQRSAGCHGLIRLCQVHSPSARGLTFDCRSSGRDGTQRASRCSNFSSRRCSHLHPAG